MPIGLVIVRSNIKFLGLRPAFHFDLLSLAFLLRKDGRVIQSSPLCFQFYAKKALAPCDQCSGQGHGNVSRFKILEDVILLALKTNIHLILKVE